MADSPRWIEDLRGAISCINHGQGIVGGANFPIAVGVAKTCKSGNCLLFGNVQPESYR